MKKILTALLTLALCVSCAFAATTEYSSTADFCYALDYLEFNYTVEGVDSDGDEKVVITIPATETVPEYNIYVYFDSNLENTYIYVWNIIEFDDADMLNVLRVCNDMNYSYRYGRFYVDETDNTVTLQIDLIYRANDVSVIHAEALGYINRLMETGYPELLPYAK